MITLDQFPSSARKSYKITNGVRTATLFITWGLVAIIFLSSFGSVIKSGGLKNILELPAVLFMSLFTSMLIGGILHGTIHGEFILKKIFRSFSLAGAIILFPVTFTILAMVWAGFSLAGFVFAIIDTFLFIKKKPLIYKHEHKYFLLERAAQEEIYAEELAVTAMANQSAGAMDSLAYLKSMLDEGIISEEEYNEKKTELLRRI